MVTFLYSLHCNYRKYFHLFSILHCIKKRVHAISASVSQKSVLRKYVYFRLTGAASGRHGPNVMLFWSVAHSSHYCYKICLPALCMSFSLWLTQYLQTPRWNCGDYQTEPAEEGLPEHFFNLKMQKRVVDKENVKSYLVQKLILFPIFKY